MSKDLIVKGLLLEVLLRIGRYMIYSGAVSGRLINQRPIYLEDCYCWNYVSIDLLRINNNNYELNISYFS